MSRREQIRMSADELAASLEQQRSDVRATNGGDGWPT